MVISKNQNLIDFLFTLFTEKYICCKAETAQDIFFLLSSSITQKMIPCVDFIGIADLKSNFEYFKCSVSYYYKILFVYGCTNLHLNT